MIKNHLECDEEKNAPVMQNSEPDRLLQRPLGSFTNNMAVRYSKVPIGSKTLTTFMSDLSRKIELAKIYTNHSFRASRVTMQSKGMYGQSLIMTVTDPFSLLRYTRGWMKMRVEDCTEQFQSHEAKCKPTTHPTCSYNNGPSIDCWITFDHLSAIYITGIPSQLILQSIFKAYALMSCLMSLS